MTPCAKPCPFTLMLKQNQQFQVLKQIERERERERETFLLISGEQYDELDYLLEQFIATHPKTWADCMEYCLLPLRTSCLQGADYTPSFLAHSR